MTSKRISIAVTLVAASLAILFPNQHSWAAESSVDVVAVCPTDFRAALQPWLEHRRREGMSVRVIESQTDGATLRSAIAAAAGPQTRYVLLVGDAPSVGTPCNPRRQTPILYHRTAVTAAWGSTPTLSSDLFYGDFDSDDAPDAVVGRLPVDEPAQLTQAILRIMAYEHSNDFGRWRGQVQLVGGVGGFGIVADTAIESVTRTLVTSVLPTETRTSVAYASPGHVFFPTGDSFSDAIVQRYQSGARFWVYAGHGQITELDRVPATAAGVPVLDTESVKKLNRPAAGSPIAVLLACYTGALDAPQDSIAEQMWLCEGGPIAVIAGSRVTMPYGNTTAAVGLIEGVFTRQLPRLGDAWLSALTEMHQPAASTQSATRQMIDALASVVSPAGTSLVDERREHMQLYNLIGDPTLQLHHPKTVALEVAPSHVCGQCVSVNLTSPVDGELTVSIDRPLGAAGDGDPNETTVAEVTSQVVAGQSQQPQLMLPPGLSGPVIVRAFVAGEKAWATAAARTIIHAAN